MSLSEAQKAKLIFLLRLLREKTDRNHGITVKDIANELALWDIHVERKSLYRDFETLRECGYHVEKYKKGTEYYYCLTEREFTLPELKLMVDAVVSSKFITTAQSDELIKKLEKCCSRYEATELQRTVFLRERPKTVNEVVFDNIGKLNEAILRRKRITFQYLDWDKNKRLVPRENGEKSDISPCFLEFNDGVYYMIAVQGEDRHAKHYRVDKMKDIVLSDVNASENVYRSEFSNPALYTSKLTNMYGGTSDEIRLSVPENKLGVVIDRFSPSETTIIPLKNPDGTYTCKVNVQVSNQLFGWLFGVSDIIKLTGPEHVRKQYDELVRMNANEAPDGN